MEAAATVHDDLRTVSHGDDSNAVVRFYWHKVEEKHYMRLNFPGDNKSEWDQPVRPQDKIRFAKQWDLYEKQMSQFGDESLIEELEFLTPPQIEQLKMANVHTIKHLAGLTDTQMNNIGMGMREIVKKAQNWLYDEHHNMEIKRLEKMLGQKDDEISSLQAKLVENQETTQSLIARVEAMEADARTGSPQKAPKKKSVKKTKPTIGLD